MPLGQGFKQVTSR